MDNGKILVADDDREIAAAIEKLLVREGYEVIKAYNGLEALDVLVSNKVNLIILDIMMPKLDGLSTMMKVRDSRISRSYYYQPNRRTLIRYLAFLWGQMTM